MVKNALKMWVDSSEDSDDGDGDSSSDQISVDMTRFGMEVPDGGSNCAKCKFHKPDGNRCGEPNFVAWAGKDKPHNSDAIPRDAGAYCCNAFDF